MPSVRSKAGTKKKVIVGHAEMDRTVLAAVKTVGEGVMCALQVAECGATHVSVAQASVASG